MRALIIAFAMYSRVPVPRVPWNDRDMKYALCFFPAVGAGLGACFWLAFRLLVWSGIPDAARAVLLAALPVLYTGGIHLDGYLDTQDAVHSYADRQERLQILKDPHVGAFAVIYGIVYGLLAAGLLSVMDAGTAGPVASGFVYARILSAIAAVRFPKAKKDGTLRAFSDRAGGHVLSVLTGELAAFAAGLLFLFGAAGAVVLVTGLLVFAWYRHLAVKTFGGTTGDLAGYFVCEAELWILAAVVLSSWILR